MIRVLLAVATAGALTLFGGRASAQVPDTSRPMDRSNPPSTERPQTLDPQSQAGQQPQGDHIAQATKETQAAIDAGKSGQADQIVQHAQQALTHAQAADKEHSTPNLKSAITDLQEAVKQGQAGKNDLAVKAAQSALGKLKG